MKVLHICLAAFFPDNYAYQENLLPKYHKKMGYDVEVIASLLTFDENGKTVYLPEPSVYSNEYGIKVTRLQNRKPIKLMRRIRLYKGTYRAIEEATPDIMFIHNGSFLDILSVRKYVKKHPGVRIYIDNHGDYFNSGRNWVSLNLLHKGLWRRCFKLIGPYTTKFYGVLPARVDFLTDVYKTPKYKTELLVMGADDEKVEEALQPQTMCMVRKELGIEENDFVIITGGKIDKNKYQIIDLMKTIRRIQRPNVKLIVFGSVVPELKDEFNELINENVRYIGWINSQDVYKYFVVSTLGVFPGRHSVLWEQAVGAGLPMLVREWEGITHIDLGGNVSFIKDDSSETVMNALIKIIDSPDNLKKMKRVAMDQGMKHFSYMDIARRSIENN